MTRITLLLLFFTFYHLYFTAQETPAAKNEKKILLLNATAHLGTGEVINRSAIGIEGDKIILVKDALTNTIDETEYDTVINLKDHHLYPGFIAPNTTLGLQEIGAVRASRDQDEVGANNPHVRSLIAYNTDSDITPTVRTNGVLIAQITPRGGIISGTSSIVQLDAWNWEDAVISEDDGIHLNWPNNMQTSGWWVEPGPTKKSDKYLEKVQAIEDYFTEAKAYLESDHDKIDLRMQAMQGLWKNQILYIHADTYHQINDIISFKKDYDLNKVVIVGGYDATFLAKKLVENDISIILNRIHSLPKREGEDVNLPYKLPAKLAELGVTFCFQNAGDMEQMGVRNLPFYAGTAVAYGLPYEKAIKALTADAADILGVSENYGTIESGKSATLFISTGDALDMMTNDLTHAFIDGRLISLDNHQKRNYEKYKNKYELE